jgi:aminopeptidase N
MFDTITYQKGGAVIHMLRETVGDETFWKGINIYLERHKFGNVESTDLQKVMEEVSHTNLEWFFAQWVYGGGYPKITLKQTYDSKKQLLELIFNQTQKSDQLVPQAFNLPIEISIKTPAGTKTEMVHVKDRQQSFTFHLKEKPSEISVDPAYKIPLMLLKPSNLVIR